MHTSWCRLKRYDGMTLPEIRSLFQDLWTFILCSRHFKPCVVNQDTLIYLRDTFFAPPPLPKSRSTSFVNFTKLPTACPSTISALPVSPLHAAGSPLPFVSDPQGYVQMEDAVAMLHDSMFDHGNHVASCHIQVIYITKHKTLLVLLSLLWWAQTAEESRPQAVSTDLFGWFLLWRVSTRCSFNGGQTKDVKRDALDPEVSKAKELWLVPSPPAALWAMNCQKPLLSQALFLHRDRNAMERVLLSKWRSTWPDFISKYPVGRRNRKPKECLFSCFREENQHLTLSLTMAK